MHKDAFNGLYKLHQLSLSKTLISGIPQGLFCNLENLHYLKVDHNYIKHIDVRMFGELKTAKPYHSPITNLAFNAKPYHSPFINLAFNAISTISNGTLMYSRNLFKLILNNNNLTIILNGMFRGLISLKLLDLSRNKIQQIKSTAFRDLKQLEEIYLNLSYLIVIHKYLFNVNTNLNKLDLSHNKLRYIENNTFGNLNKLATVNLHGNKLAYIQKGMLTGLSHGKFSHYEASRSTVFDLLQLLIFVVKLCLSVTFLNIGENRIRIIEAKSFENMTNLHGLNLDKNNISNIHRSMFTGLCALLTLNLENNKIKAIEDGSFPSFNQNLNLYLDNITMNFISWKYFLQKA